MSTLEAAVPLTKSQKKRLKRNKAKTRKAAAAAEEVTVVPATPVLDPLNSHDALRIGLQNLGFELSDIDRSIEEMWNLGLDYSDINDVATFMTNEKASAATSAAATSVVKDVQVDPSVTEVNSSTPNSIVTSASTAIESSTSDIGRPKRAASEEEVKTVSTAMDAKEPGSPKVPLTVTKNGQPVSAETQTKHTNTNAPSIATNGHGHSNGSSNNNVAKSKRNVEAKQAPPTLKMKLNVVANDENLTDAIVALTEWIVKAATPTEVSHIRPNQFFS
jgi:type II secretory pathway component PulM